MVAYPIRVPRKSYRGRDRNKLRKIVERNQLAELLENYLNDRIERCDREIQQYFYGEIAADLRLNVDDVRKILYGVEAGGNGLTVVKRPEAEL